MHIRTYNLTPIVYDAVTIGLRDSTLSLKDIKVDCLGYNHNHRSAVSRTLTCAYWIHSRPPTDKTRTGN